MQSFNTPSSAVRLSRTRISAAVALTAAALTPALATDITPGSITVWPDGDGEYRIADGVELSSWKQAGSDYAILTAYDGTTQALELLGTFKVRGNGAGITEASYYSNGLRIMDTDSSPVDFSVSGSTLDVDLEASGGFGMRGMEITGWNTASRVAFNNAATKIKVGTGEGSLKQSAHLTGVYVQGMAVTFSHAVDVTAAASASNAGRVSGVQTTEYTIPGTNTWRQSDVLFAGPTKITAQNAGSSTVYGISSQGNAPTFTGESVSISASRTGPEGGEVYGWYQHGGYQGAPSNGLVAETVKDFSVTARSNGSSLLNRGIFVWNRAKLTIKAARTLVTAEGGSGETNGALLAGGAVGYPGKISVEGEELTLRTKGSASGGKTVRSYAEGSLLSLNAEKMEIFSEADQADAEKIAASAEEGGRLLINSDEQGADQGKTAVISGDLISETSSSDGTLLVANLTNASSSLTGKAWAGERTELDIALTNGAVWNVTENSQITTLTAGGGHAYLGTAAADFATLGRSGESFTPVSIRTKTLAGDAGNFYMRADIDGNTADTLWIGSGTGSHKLFVRSFGAEPSSEQMEQYLVHEEAGDASFALGNPQQLVDAGTYVYELAQRSAADEQGGESATEWYLRRAERPTEPDTPLTPASETVLAFNGANTMAALYWGGLEDLRKRLGEVREQKDMYGAWASAMGGVSHLKNFPGLRTRLNGFRLNVGADKKVSDTWLVGGYFRFATGDERVRTSYSGPSHADVHSEGISLYATKIWDSGAYMDFVASGDLFHQEVRGTMIDGRSFKGNYSTWGWGLSAEAGHQLRFGEKEQWFVEPSVQLAYYRAQGEDYTLDNGMKVDDETAGGLTGRAGTLVGRRFYDETGVFDGDAYIRAGVIHQFGGGHDTVINGSRFEINGLGTRWYAGVGGEIRVGRDAKLFGYVETQHGNRFSTEFEGRLGWKVLF